jgi:hypothetical protein
MGWGAIGSVEIKANVTTTGTINGVTAAQFSELASGGGGWSFTNYLESISATTVLTNIKENTFSNGKKYVIFLLNQYHTSYGHASGMFMAIYENSSSTTTTKLFPMSRYASTNINMGVYGSDGSGGLYAFSTGGGEYNPSTKTLSFSRVDYPLDVYW